MYSEMYFLINDDASVIISITCCKDRSLVISLSVSSNMICYDIMIIF